MKNFIIILFLFISIVSSSQTIEDISLIRKSLSQTESRNRWDIARTYNNEYQFIFSKLFLFYKNFFSSQDANSCSFTPSCSVYAIQAIKKQGTVVGLINFFDRFTRCNSLSPEDYKLDESTKLLIDPVRDFYFNER